MHSRALVLWFGVALGGCLLGCPPAAKNAKDAPAATEGASSDAEQQGEAKDSKEEKQESASPPSGGW